MSSLISCPAPFRFPETESMVLPDPSAFFAKHLLSSPLPTNSFFQNFVLNDGDQPEYIHPYLLKSSAASLGLSFPSRVSDPRFIYQSFAPDLTISSSSGDDSDLNPKGAGRQRHLVSSFDDLSVTLDFPGSLRFHLVRGSPYVTCSTVGCNRVATGISISAGHDVIYFTSSSDHTKHTFQLANGRTYLCYSSGPLHLAHASLNDLATTVDYAGVIRLAYLPDPRYEQILDRYSGCYPVSGEAELTRPFCVKYKWKTRGAGELLMLAHPLHLRLLVEGDAGSATTVLKNFKYPSIDGELVGVVGRSWVLRADPVPVTWHSILGLREESYGEIISALYRDVDALKPLSTTSTYYYGKAVARAARLALIAEEVHFSTVVPAVQLFLENALTPWLEGTFFGNAFLHDPSWGGVVTKQGAVDAGADCGFGLYNAHHYHLGYFLYAIAVLSKIDPVWGRKHRSQAYALAGDIVSLSKGPHARYPRLRCFDLWKLHSWEGGLAEFVDGRNQQGTGEALATGLSNGDAGLVATGSTLAALEVQAAQTWWHVREGEDMYKADFVQENQLVGVLWANKRGSALWFAPPESKECRLSIHVLPLLPVTEVLFQDAGFVRELVRWVSPALEREVVNSDKLAIDLALRLPLAEVVNSDKMQVYAGLDVTTNKVTPAEARGVPHHLLSDVDPAVAAFWELGAEVVADIAARGRLSIVAGGSNSFVHALLADMYNPCHDPFDASVAAAQSPVGLRYPCCLLWVDVDRLLLYEHLDRRVDGMLKSRMFEELEESYDPERRQGSGGGYTDLWRSIGVLEFDRFFERYSAPRR